ncbi:hypothetical protein M885DRAFT_590121 [Pelagophyceae sp. CCMP2097]|nr:hypothetical protein M885DRAFT_590121 [Pelagophyceae sp. CCMP2097]
MRGALLLLLCALVAADDGVGADAVGAIVASLERQAATALGAVQLVDDAECTAAASAYWFAQGYVTRGLEDATRRAFSEGEVDAESDSESGEPIADALRASAQRLQAARIADLCGAGRPTVALAQRGVGDVDCAVETISHGDCHVETIGMSHGGEDGHSRGACGRLVSEGFATRAEAALLVGALQSGMQNLFHQGGRTSLAADANAAPRLGQDAARILRDLKRRILRHLESEFDVDELLDAGALLTRLSAAAPADEWEVDASHVYWGPHVDQANILAYDYSAILYLNDHGADFQGGEFDFLDADADKRIEPRAGMLVAFTSGLENVHRVHRVTAGERYALAVWFSRAGEQHDRT